MRLVLLAAMIVSGIGMVVGLARQRAGAGWGKPFAVVCVMIALAAAVWSLKTQRDSGYAAVVDREITFQRLRGKKLGLYLAERHAGAKVMIITEPWLGTQAGGPNPLVEGLKAGMGSALTVVAEASPEVPADRAKAYAKEMPPEATPPSIAGGAAGPGEVMPPLAYWYTAKIFDALVRTYAGQFDLLVTTIGLPPDAGDSAILGGGSCPRIAVLDGSIQDLKRWIKPSMIVAATTYKPKAIYDEKPVPEDLDEAFGKRFLLVTPETLEQTEAANPLLFRVGE